MPKMLVLETCLVNYKDDRGGIAEPAGTLPIIDAEQALALARTGRMLFTRKSDDPTKGTRTAPPEVVEQARHQDNTQPTDTGGDDDANETRS